MAKYSGMRLKRLRLLFAALRLDILWNWFKRKRAGSNSMKAMILAAGRGERMRPLTDTVPKPLLEVAGRSLLFRHLDALTGAGINDFVINTAWLSESVKSAFLAPGVQDLNVTFSHEGESALETGGALRRALPLLGDSPFWLVNGDVLCEYDFRRRELEPGTLAHLVLVPNPEHNPAGDFVCRDGAVLSDSAAGERYTFAGISLLHPGILEFADTKSEVFPLAPLLRAAAAAGKVTGEVFDGLWMDIGTPERLDEATRLLRSRPA